MYYFGGTGGQERSKDEPSGNNDISLYQNHYSNICHVYPKVFYMRNKVASNSHDTLHDFVKLRTTKLPSVSWA